VYAGHQTAETQKLPGTAFYMASEQIENDPVDARTDIFSPGITAYEMATEEQRKRRMMSLCMFYHHEHHQDLTQLMAGFSEELKRLGAELRVSDLGEI